MLTLLANWMPQPWSKEYYIALAEAYRRLGDEESATTNYREALNINPNLPKAHLGLAMLRMPGDDYMTWLERIYDLLVPESVIEIGVFEGASLSKLKSPTVVIGVDPEPTLLFPLKTETHISTETSDVFFAERRPKKLLRRRRLSVGFIDGRHVFEQALRDFINLERYCGARSVILFHDTLPLDEPTH